MSDRFISASLGVIFFIQTCLPGSLLSEESKSQPIEQEYVIKIPASWGKISSPHVNTKSSDTVFLIEDIHAHPQAQKHIYQILKLLSRFNRKPLQILVEGSSKEIDLKPIRRMKSHEAVKTVSQKYLARGILSGDEFFAIHSDVQPMLQGAEIESSYQENLTIYRAFKKRESSILFSLKELAKSLNDNVEKLLNPALKEIIRERQNYQSYQRKLTEHAQFLLEKARQKNISNRPYPNLTLLSKAFQIEKKEDFKGIDQKIQSVVYKISKVAQEKELKNLVKWTLQAHLYENKTSKYLEYLLKLAEDCKISTPGLKHLERYQAYATLFEKIDTKKISKEEKAIFKELGEKYSRSEIEKNLFNTLFHFEALKNILTLKASPEDYKSSVDAPPEELKNLFQAIKERFPALDEGIRVSSRFYECAQKRNHHFAHALVRQIKSSDQPVILILGGFHTQAVQNLLEKKGLQTYVITPQFSPTNDDVNYERMLLGKHTSLEKLLIHNASTLRQPPITERIGDFLSLQLAILERSIIDFTRLEDVHGFFEKSIYEAKQNQSLSLELLDQLKLRREPAMIILEGKNLAIAVQQKNGKSSPLSSRGIKPEDILNQKELGTWRIQTFRIAHSLESMGTTLETPVSVGVSVIFEDAEENNKIKEFLSNPEFLKKTLYERWDQASSIRVRYYGISPNKKTIYKAEVFDREDQVLKTLAIKIYDAVQFKSDKQKIIESWKRWDAMSQLDSEGLVLARGLGYSEDERIFAQEWVESKNLRDVIQEALTHKNPDLLKNSLRNIITRSIQLYIKSGKKFIPWDYQPSNIISERFVDEEDVPLEPNPFEVVEHLRLLPFYLRVFREIHLQEEYEFLWQTIMEAFEKISSKEEGLNFLYQAYAADKENEKYLFDPERIFSQFLLTEYLKLKTSEQTVPPLSIKDIESTLSDFIQPDLRPEYHRALMQERPLKPGQVSLHLGQHPTGTLALAETLFGLRVYSIDNNSSLLENTRNFLDRLGLPLLKLIDFNAEYLDESHGFPADSIDHIDMKELFGGSFSGDAGKIIRNVIWLLKEGGTVLVSDTQISERLNNPTEVALLKRVSEQSKEWDLEWKIKSLHTLDQYKNKIYLATLKKKSKKISPEKSSPPEVQIEFEKTPKSDRVWRFLSNPEFINQIGQTSNSLTIKVEFKGKTHQGKKIYKADIYDSKDQKIQSLALNLYDRNAFEANKERIIQSWKRWNEMSKLDSEGRSMARGLGYSQEDGIFVQEWIEGKSLDQMISKAIAAKDISLLKSVLREAIQNAVRLFILSDQKYIPWDYLSSNVIEGRFVDEDEIPINPKADEVVSYLSLFSRNLQMFRSQISEEEEYEFLWRAILDTFEKESTRENGLNFLYEAYHLAFHDQNHRLLDPALNFANFLFREYMNLIIKNPKIHPILDEIEETISHGPRTEDYQRKLILGRPLKPGQISLHIGVHPSAVFPVAEAMSGLRVFGIDISDIHMRVPQRQMKTKFKHLDREGFFLPKFFMLNAEDLDEAHGFPANSVDHISMKQLFGGTSFVNAPEKTSKIVQNIIHLLREGGTVLLTDNNLNEDHRNPTEVQILKIVSERSEEWELEWDIQPLGAKDHYDSNIFLATLKKKIKKASRIKRERMFATLWNVLERYSNVHRGLGQHSQVSTHLFERARYWIGEKFGIDSKKQVVILATNSTLAMESLAHNLRLNSDDYILTDSKEPRRFLNFRSGLIPIKEDWQIDLETLKNLLRQTPTKLVTIQRPRVLGLTPENILDLSRIIHENGARLLVDASDWPVDQINVKSLGIDYLIFEGGRVSPFGPTVIIADLEHLKTREDEPPYEVGGGTKEIARADKVIWGKAPEKFEVGSPNIVGAILLASVLKNPEGLPNLKIPDLPHRNGYHSIKALEEALIGKDVKVPTRNGEKMYINFDNAASTPTFIPVLEAIKEYLQAIPTRRLIMKANAFEKILKYFGAFNQEYDMLFFRNTSEAINFLAYHLRLSPDAVVVNSLLEHNSNELPWRNKNLIRLSVDENGFMDIAHLERLLIEYNEMLIHGNKRIELVALSGASNVLGTVNDLPKISELVHRYEAKLIVDAAQLAAHRKVDMDKLDIDFLVYSAHKIYAPFGHGGLIFRNDLLRVSDAEDASPEGMIALAKMMDILTKIGLSRIAEHEEELLHYALEKFEILEDIPGVKIKILGIEDPSSPLLRKKTGVISFNIKIPDAALPENLREMPYLPYHLVAAVLAEEGGIGVRAGCFCADLLLQQMLNISDEDAQRLEEDLLKGDRSNLPGTTRMSFGIYNTKEEIDRFFEILTNLAQGKYDLSKYQLNKKSGEYYTVEHLQTMGKFLKSIEENVFGLSSEEKIISEADQELYEFIERFHNEREKLLTQGQELLDEYRSTLKEGITISFRNLYQNYLDAKERLSSLPYRFAVWVLKDFPRSTGKRHIVFIQRGSSALGYLMKDLAKELGWNHLKFHDLYMNSKIAGHLAGYMMGTLPISEMKANGNNTYEEIFEYVAQENLLDGAPIVFIDTGMIGSNPWLLRKLIHNPSLWRHSELPFKKIDISTRLFFLNSHGKEEEIRFAHENQVEGFNEAADAPHDQIDLLNDFNHSYGIASFLDKGVKYPYDRPERLIWKEEPSGKKIEPLLVPNDAFTQLVALSQRLAAEDLIRERVVQNDPLLKEFATTSTPSISDDQTILLSEQSIDGVSTQALPKNKRIAVIEQTENDAMAYAGNLVKRLEKENKIQKFSLRDLELLADFTNFLKKFKPDFILLPQGRSDLEAMIQDIVEETGREITILSYVSLDLLPFQNFFFPFSAQTAQVVKKAIQTHKSQVTRTAYDQIFEYSSQVAGQKLQFYQPAMEDSPYAQAFRVGFIHQGKVEITSNDTRYKIGPARAPYTINLSDDIPLLVISPHADDLEIAAGGLIRSYLEASQRPSRTRVLNWVIGTGDEWGVIFEPDHPTADLTEDAQIGIKRHIRREEALEAGSVLSKETSGKLEVSVFGLLSASQHPQRANVILPMNTPQVFKDLRYLQMKLNDFYHEYISLFKNEEMLTVILPHPDDAHPHHQMATKIVLEALSQLSIAQGISIQLLFYSSPWAGSFNTYYVSNKNQTLDETVSVDLKDKISIAEKAKRSLGIIIGELFAGFGKKPLSSEALGGSFAERFMRKTIRPTVASQKQINLPLPAPQTLQPEDSQNIFESAA